MLSRFKFLARLNQIIGYNMTKLHVISFVV